MKTIITISLIIIHTSPLVNALQNQGLQAIREPGGIQRINSRDNFGKTISFTGNTKEEIQKQYAQFLSQNGDLEIKWTDANEREITVAAEKEALVQEKIWMLLKKRKYFLQCNSMDDHTISESEKTAIKNKKDFF